MFILGCFEKYMGFILYIICGGLEISKLWGVGRLGGGGELT